MNPARLLAGLIVFGCNVSPHPHHGFHVDTQLLQLCVRCGHDADAEPDPWCITDLTVSEPDRSATVT